ncbi:MAG: hypothetical protein NHG12_00520 [Candidatus Shikimatogenerans bostrichidophilus]|nr:MAG: hypothetical protein NHG12_00520 [Candidatus Shikimatogenerans bostrichidophilus]
MININKLLNFFFKKKIYIKKINKEKILLILKEKIIKILNNEKKNKKYNIYIKDNNLIIEKLFLKKKKIVKINNLNRNIIFLIKKEIKNLINKELNNLKYYYFFKKKNKIIHIKLINIFNKILIFKDKYENELYYNIKNKNIYINFFIIGNLYFFLVKKVFLNKNNKIIIILSRNDKLFIKELFKLEIPEIKDGIIKIKKIVRIPGFKTKIVIYSKNKNIDPIGTCLGFKGIRIKFIKKELNNERIDLIKYTKNINLYIERLLYPFKIKKKIILKEKIYLFFKKKLLSKIIGINGVNIKLISYILKKNIIINEYKK